MPEIRTIQLHPAQPCGMLKGNVICGQPATRATVEAAAVSAHGPAGYLLCLPVCADCAAATPRIAAADEAPHTHDLVLATVSMVLPTSQTPAVLIAAAGILDDHVDKMRRDARVLRERAAEIAQAN